MLNSIAPFSRTGSLVGDIDHRRGRRAKLFCLKFSRPDSRAPSAPLKTCFFSWRRRDCGSLRSAATTDSVFSGGQRTERLKSKENMVTSDSKPNNAMPLVEEEVLFEEKSGVGIMTLNRPSKLNCLTLPMLQRAIDHYKKWEEDDSMKLIILKGNGRVFCAGGDLNMFYRLGKADEGWKEVVYVKYWFDYHLSTFKKPLVGIWHGLVMGGGAGLTVNGQFRVATEKTIFAMPEVGIGFHPDCGASHWLSLLPGAMGEYMALLGTRLDGADLYVSGLATHYVPLEKLPELEQRLQEVKSSDVDEVAAVIGEFNAPAKIGPNSIFNKDRQSLIDRTFSKASVEEIITALEELKEPGQEWVKEPLKILKRSSPTSLKVTLQSVRDGRKQTLPEALQREFRLTINSLRAIISDDLYEGIRAIVVDKDNRPKWQPSTLEEVIQEKVDQMVLRFDEKEDLRLPSDGVTPRWHGTWEEIQQA